MNDAANDGKNALMLASLKGHKEIFPDHGANPAAKHNRGWTAFMFAKQEGHEKIVTLLKNAQRKI
ncbi:MAG: ankyrin repeat domain-containing protein [Nitrospirales bacterium]|nr:ankyrin repeat domain-containing protein [Nitrospirales bacterium]